MPPPPFTTRKSRVVCWFGQVRVLQPLQIELKVGLGQVALVLEVWATRALVHHPRHHRTATPEFLAPVPLVDRPRLEQLTQRVRQ
jgi:hypothetical protein